VHNRFWGTLGPDLNARSGKAIVVIPPAKNGAHPSSEVAEVQRPPSARGVDRSELSVLDVLTSHERVQILSFEFGRNPLHLPPDSEAVDGPLSIQLAPVLIPNHDVLWGTSRSAYSENGWWAEAVSANLRSH